MKINTLKIAGISLLFTLSQGLFSCSDSAITEDEPVEIAVDDEEDIDDDIVDDEISEEVQFTTVNTIPEFIATLGQSDVNIKLAPGTYSFGPDDVASGLIPHYEIFVFRGNNTNYDFTDVIFEFDTELWSSYGNEEVVQLRLYGEDITVKNLTMVDMGDSAPTHRARNIHLDGINNTIDGFDITSRGSFPYGYGDMFGKGGGSVIAHNKHSTILIRGENNTFKNSSILSRSYGHLVFVQGGIDVLIENVDVEGEVRTTDDILAEEGTGSPADNVDFMTVFGYKLLPGYMISLQEAGFRCYTTGTHYITGEETRTERVTIRNCTATRVRSGFNTIFGTGPHIIENSTAIECENGFAIKQGNSMVNCKADARYGPAYNSGYNNDGDQQIELEILDSGETYGTHPIIFVGGSNHNVTLTSSNEDVSQERYIQVGGVLSIVRSQDVATPEAISTSSSTIINNTKYPVLLTDSSVGNNIISCGTVTDNGSVNSITQTECN